jgi:acyl dehydratase
MERMHIAEATRATDPLCFDDVAVGDFWLSPARTVQERDVLAFADLTGDRNPLHLDEEFARQTPFGRPIAHGLLGMSLVGGLGSRSPWLNTAVFVRVVEWRFARPLYVGDTVHVKTTVLDKGTPGRRRGLITWKRQLINQHNDIVQEGTTETLVPLHVASPKLPR